MKVEIKELESKSVDFPKLMKHSDGSIYLFRKHGIATVISGPNNESCIMYTVGDHAVCVNMEGFIDFNNEVLLSNR